MVQQQMTNDSLYECQIGAANEVRFSQFPTNLELLMLESASNGGTVLRGYGGRGAEWSCDEWDSFAFRADAQH